jgi:ABC-type sugar transport system ATPase subunit
MHPVIQVSSLRKTYGSTVAAEEASFEVKVGEIFGLIGPNGAGKTTTMECIEGLRKPDHGAIAVLGIDPFRQIYKLQERIGVQLQQGQLQKRIKVWEAVDLWASLYRKKAVDGERLRPSQGRAGYGKQTGCDLCAYRRAFLERKVDSAPRCRLMRLTAASARQDRTAKRAPRSFHYARGYTRCH